MADYQVVKERSWWVILRDGKRVGICGQRLADGWWLPSSSKTKKAAISAIEELHRREQRIQEIIAEEEAGDYHWTETEEAEIAKLAEALRQGGTHQTLSGKVSQTDSQRERHKQDLKGRETWRGNTADEGRYHFALIGRKIEARTEAFRRARISLVVSRDTSWVRPTTESEWGLCNEVGENAEEESFNCRCGRGIAMKDAVEKIEGRMCLDCAAKLEKFLLETPKS